MKKGRHVGAPFLPFSSATLSPPSPSDHEAISEREHAKRDRDAVNDIVHPGHAAIGRTRTTQKPVLAAAAAIVFAIWKRSAFPIASHRGFFPGRKLRCSITKRGLVVRCIFTGCFLVWPFKAGCGNDPTAPRRVR